MFTFHNVSFRSEGVVTFVFRDVPLRYAVYRCVTLRSAMYVSLCYVSSCFVSLCSVSICYASLCYVMLRFFTLMSRNTAILRLSTIGRRAVSVGQGQLCLNDCASRAISWAYTYMMCTMGKVVVRGRGNRKKHALG